MSARGEISRTARPDARSVDELDTRWRCVATSREMFHWHWSLSELDRVYLDDMRACGEVITMQERAGGMTRLLAARLPVRRRR